MNHFNPGLILCPTDFSDRASLALCYARDLAIAWNARLLVLYANQFLPPPHFTSGQVEELARALERSKQSARENLVSYIQETIGGQVDVTAVVVEDHPVPAIVNAAENYSADLIVMGTHGRNEINRVLMGSVAERILRETDRPVLTVRQKSGAAQPAGLAIRRVLCPVNFTEVARYALDHAVSAARAFKAELVLLKVVESDEKGSEAEVHQRLCDWVPPDFRKHCDIREVVRSGNAPSQIISAAEELDADLIVLGAQHKLLRDVTVIGATTMRVTRHSPCPVLTVIRRRW